MASLRGERDATVDDLVRGTRVTSSPSITTLPLLAGVSPVIARSVVDLPAPLEPISVTTSPSSRTATRLERLDAP